MSGQHCDDTAQIKLLYNSEQGAATSSGAPGGNNYKQHFFLALPDIGKNVFVWTSDNMPTVLTKDWQ